MVIATQNPRGHHGTYPLPESQRDRFMMRISIGFPDPATEIKILDSRRTKDPLTEIESVLSLAEVESIQNAIMNIHVPEPCLQYLARLAQASRTHEEVNIPISPRGSIALMRATQALAFIRAQEFVDIDLIKSLAPSVLAHRLGLRTIGATAFGEGAPEAWVERELLQRVPVA
jgi:MoxR-like ATPase